MRTLFRPLPLIALVLAVAAVVRAAVPQTPPSGDDVPPNVVIIFADDLGYGDIGSFGATGYGTPNLDRMAAEGVRLTDFYAAQAVCSASRAALLTGAYPNRIGITGALDHRARHGLNPAETTIASMLKQRQYATAIVGKWHLGHLPQFLPRRYGFDEYYGLPYSNDMWPFHPERPGRYPPLPLIEGERTIETNPDQSRLTTDYTARAVRFIERHRDEPFFLYLAHSMPHVPLFVSDKFEGTTERGLFGDVIAEIDWSVGQVLATLERLGLDSRTLVVFTSDNGPWAEYGNHAGSAGPLRGSKGTAFEGGVRVPFVARWPGRIPAGAESAAPAMTIDLLPTIARLAGVEPPPRDRIDGRDIWPLLDRTPGAESPHDALLFYWGRELHAVRSGRWKLHLAHPYRDVVEWGRDGRPGRISQGQIGQSLFDLVADRGESRDVSADHPDEVQRLEAIVEAARADLGDSLTRRDGTNLRPPGEGTGPN